MPRTGSTAPDNRLLRAIDGWSQARASRLKVYREMAGFRCENYERGESEVGDPGCPRCYQGGGPRDEWCQPCQQRNALYNTYWILKKIDRERFRLVCGILDRREKARMLVAVDPARANSVDPSTRENSTSAVAGVPPSPSQPAQRSEP